MAQITIYTTSLCPYCSRAKALLEHKHMAYEEIDVSHDPTRRAQMAARAGGRRTVPQIFVGKRHVGGCDELYALDAKGGLETLLASA